jgi:hypothetical protein
VSVNGAWRLVAWALAGGAVFNFMFALTRNIYKICYFYCMYMYIKIAKD